MERVKYINQIIDSLHRSQQATCTRMSKIPGVAITPSQWAILKILHYKKSVRVKDLAKLMSVSGSAVTQLTDELVKKGYVKRIANPNDRRTTLVQPTTKCCKMIDSIQELYAKSLEELFTNLSDKELKILSELHKKMLDPV